MLLPKTLEQVLLLAAPALQPMQLQPTPVHIQAQKEGADGRLRALGASILQSDGAC